MLLLAAAAVVVFWPWLAGTVTPTSDVVQPVSAVVVDIPDNVDNDGPKLVPKLQLVVVKADAVEIGSAGDEQSDDDDDDEFDEFDAVVDDDDDDPEEEDDDDEDEADDGDFGLLFLEKNFVITFGFDFCCCGWWCCCGWCCWG